jgi:hypothetical protein
MGAMIAYGDHSITEIAVWPMRCLMLRRMQLRVRCRVINDRAEVYLSSNLVTSSSNVLKFASGKDFVGNRLTSRREVLLVTRFSFMGDIQQEGNESKEIKQRGEKL